MNLVEYQDSVNAAVRTDAYNSLPQERQQAVLQGLRSEYLKERPFEEEAVNRISESINKKHLRATGQGRYIPMRSEIDAPLPWEDQDWAIKSEDVKEKLLEDFRGTIPDLAAQDPVNKEDRGFYLNAVTDHALRKAIGGDTGWASDKFKRVFEGFTAGILGFVGADEKAQDVRNWVADNPDYDDDFTAKLATGLGDLGSSTAVFVAGSIVTGSPVGGTGFLLAGTSTRKYQDAYNQAIDMGMSQEKANDAGVGAIPGAAIEMIGDRLIAGRFLPKKFIRGLKGADSVKRKTISQIMNDESLRKKAFGVMRDGFGEGASEWMGDLSSGYGSYLMTEEESFIPDATSQFESFALGAVLGGGVASATEIGGIRKGPEGFTTKNNIILGKTQAALDDTSGKRSSLTQAEVNESVSKLVNEGRYKEAYEAANTVVEGDNPDALFPDSFGASTKPAEVLPENLARQAAAQSGEGTANQARPEQPSLFPLSESAEAQALSDVLTNPNEGTQDKVNKLIPDRARVKDEIDGLGDDGALDPERSTEILGILDILANKWADSGAGRVANDFFKKLNFEGADSLIPFQDIVGKFITGKDNQGATTYQDVDGNTNIAFTQNGEVGSLFAGVMSALRQTGIMEDILGADGMEVIRENLQTNELGVESDQRLANNALDWMARAEPKNEVEAEVFGKLKNWVGDVYKGVRDYFAQFLPSKFQANKKLDEQFAKLFGFDPTAGTPQSFGREQTTSELNPDVNSPLSRSRAATRLAAGAPTPVAQPAVQPAVTPVTSPTTPPINPDREQAAEEDPKIKAALEAAEASSKDLFGIDITDDDLDTESETLDALAFHGTPHEILGGFSTKFMGTGEGLQVFGWGLYFATAKDVAKDYRETLSRKYGRNKFMETVGAGLIEGDLRFDELLNDIAQFGYDTVHGWAQKDAIEGPGLEREGKVSEDYYEDATQRLAWMSYFNLENIPSIKEFNHEGNLYKVDFKAEDNELLDWDKDFKDQHPEVKKKLVKLGLGLKSEVDHPYTGQQIYNFINDGSLFSSEDNKARSLALLDIGIKGIKFLDGQSRRNREGTYNFVVFDGADIEILEKNDTPVSKETREEIVGETLDALTIDPRVSSQAQATLQDSRNIQRGHPESFATISTIAENTNTGMAKIFSYGKGMYDEAMEYLGDLYNHASSSNDIKEIRQKINANLGFHDLQEELDTDLLNNIILKRAEERGLEIDQDTIPTLAREKEIQEEFKTAKKYRELSGLLYADMYSSLKAYTPQQAIARNIAIAYGMGRYVVAENLAKQLMAFESAARDIPGMAEIGFDQDGIANIEGRSNNETETKWNQIVSFSDTVTDENIDEKLAAVKQNLRSTIPQGALNRAKKLMLRQINDYALAYHGTGADIEGGFDTDYVGTGEGVQAYGWGLYFAENKSVGKFYQEKIGQQARGKNNLIFTDKANKAMASMPMVSQSDLLNISKAFAPGQSKRATAAAIRRNTTSKYLHKLADLVKSGDITLNPDRKGDDFKGNLYKIDFKAEDNELLDWDKRPEDQHPEVIEKLKEAGVWIPSVENGIENSTKGSSIYNSIFYTGTTKRDGLKSDKERSELLLKHGIKGIKFLDGMSRMRGEGYSNFVAFDGKDIEILEKNGDPVSKEKADEVKAEMGALQDGQSQSNTLAENSFNRAIADNDLIKAKEIQDRIAESLGFEGGFFHGSAIKGIKKFGVPIFFSKSESLSRDFAGSYNKEGPVKGGLYKAYLNLGNSLKLWEFKDWVDVVESIKSSGKDTTALENAIAKYAYSMEFDGFSYQFTDAERAKFDKEEKTWENMQKSMLKRREEIRLDPDADPNELYWNVDGYDIPFSTKELDSKANFFSKTDLIYALKDLGFDSVGQLEGGDNPSDAAAVLVFDNKQIETEEVLPTDEEGKLIPISERFGQESTDVGALQDDGQAPAPPSQQTEPDTIITNKDGSTTAVRNATDLFNWMIEKDLIAAPFKRFFSKAINNREIANFLNTVKVQSSPFNSYDPVNNIISLNFDGSDVAVMALHESTHAVLSNAIARDPKFKADIEGLMQDVRNYESADPKMKEVLELAEQEFAEYQKANPNKATSFSKWFSMNHKQLRQKTNASAVEIRAAYALTSADEFVAAAMSDVNFRGMMHASAADQQLTAWQKFKQMVMDVFGFGRVIQKQNVSDAFDAMIDFAIDENIVSHTLPFMHSNETLNAINPDSKNDGGIKEFGRKFRAIRKGKISDKTDRNTATIMKIVKSINPKEILALPDTAVKEFMRIIDNVYDARNNQVKDPALREGNAATINALVKYKFLIDQVAINKIKAANAGLFDMSQFKGDPDNRQEVEKFINDSAIANETQAEKNDRETATANRSAAQANRLNKKQEAWRKKYSEAVEEIKSEYKSASDWVEEFELINGSKIDPDLRKVVMSHFDYLTKIANVGEMTGKELYTHFYAVNNLMDGRIAYVNKTTVPYIQRVRDGKVKFSELKSKFRDPVLYKNKFLKSIDGLVRLTELMQTQLDRWSAHSQARAFLQADLMGPLMQKIMLDAENMRDKDVDEYIQHRKELEAKLGREMKGADNVAMSIYSRLTQFRIGEDPNKALMRNIKNERQSHKNALDQGDSETVSSHKNNIIPIFDRMVVGLEADNLDAPMDVLMESAEERIGTGDFKVGEARLASLNKMIDILDRSRLSNEVISEGFYGEPFEQWANYVPRHVIEAMATKTTGELEAVSIDAKMDTFDENQFQGKSVTGRPSHLKRRSDSLGPGTRYYANNIENTFDRAARISAMTVKTTAERFILKERLKKGNPINKLIKGEHTSDTRVNQLEAWAKDLVYNAMFNGDSLDAMSATMKLFNEMYARVALSGVHQGVTQSIAGFSDYTARTGNLGGAMDASLYYVSNREKMNEFFSENARWIANRSLMGEVELDRKKNPIIDEDSIRAMPIVKGLEKFNKDAGKVITFSLRQGDDFTAKTLVIAEYVRLMKVKGRQIGELSDVDWANPDGLELSQAIINVERNFNASNKVLRGQLFTDRDAKYSFARNITLAFSGHVTMLGAQLNLATRDIIELAKTGENKEEIKSKLQTIGAILGQTFMFTSSRFLINGSIAMLITGLIRDLYDDEDGKIAEIEGELQDARATGDHVLVAHAEAELQAATAIKKHLYRYSNRNFSPAAFGKAVLREELGVLHLFMQGPQIPQKLLFMVPDRYSKELMKEEISAKADVMSAQIADLKDRKRFGEAAMLSEQLVLLEASEYIPYSYPNFSNLGVGGITGTTMEQGYASLKEASDGVLGLEEFNWNDLVLAGRSAGFGQADMLKILKEWDKVEDKLYDIDTALEEKLPEAQAKAIEAREKKRIELIKRLTR